MAISNRQLDMEAGVEGEGQEQDSNLGVIVYKWGWMRSPKGQAGHRRCLRPPQPGAGAPLSKGSQR